MKFLSVSLENYGSFHGRHSVRLNDRGLMSVLGWNEDRVVPGSNGSGKSHFLESIDWCLFGDVPRDDVADSVVNSIAQGNCCVTVDLLEDDGTPIRIQRFRDYEGEAAGPRLYVAGVAKTALDAKETQRHIEKVLGLDRTVFHAVALFAQNDRFQFADATDGERKELLTRILPELTRVDDLQEHAATKLKALDGDLARLTIEHASLEASMRACAQHGEQAVQNANAWGAEQEARCQVQQAAIMQAKHDLAAAQAAAGPRPMPVPVRAPEAPSEKYAQAQQARERAQAIRAQVMGVVGQMGALRQDAARFRDERLRLEKTPERTCSKCGQDVPQHDHSQELAVAIAGFEAAVAQGLRLKADAEALEQQAQQAEQQSRDLMQQGALEHAARDRAFDALTADARLANQRWEAAQSAIVQYQGRVSQQQLALDRLVLAQNPHDAQVAELAKTFEALKAAWAQKTDALEAARKQASLYAFWKDGLGAKGLKSYLLDSKVGEMAAEANRWVQLLTNNSTWVEFRTQREVGTGKKRRHVEDLSIKVFRAEPDGTVSGFNYRSWSGGEKALVALGINFGLARLIAKRASKTYDFLALDEVFQKSLDSVAKEAVAGMLQQLSKEKSTILVVDHEAQFQSMFDGRLLVRKKNRRSWIAEGAT